MTWLTGCQQTAATGSCPVLPVSPTLVCAGLLVKQFQVKDTAGPRPSLDLPFTACLVLLFLAIVAASSSFYIIDHGRNDSPKKKTTQNLKVNCVPRSERRDEHTTCLPCAQTQTPSAVRLKCESPSLVLSSLEKRQKSRSFRSSNSGKVCF